MARNWTQNELTIALGLVSVMLFRLHGLGSARILFLTEERLDLQTSGIAWRNPAGIIRSSRNHDRHIRHSSIERRLSQ